MRQKGGPNQQWLSWFVYLSCQGLKVGFKLPGFDLPRLARKYRAQCAEPKLLGYFEFK